MKRFKFVVFGSLALVACEVPATGSGQREDPCDNSYSRGMVKLYADSENLLEYESAIWGIPTDMPAYIQRSEDFDRFDRYIRDKERYCSRPTDRDLCLKKTTDPALEDDMPVVKEEAAEMIDFMKEDRVVSNVRRHGKACMADVTLPVRDWVFKVVPQPKATVTYTVSDRLEVAVTDVRFN